LLRAFLPFASLALVAAVPAPADDPYLWLEQIEGPRALAQVKEWNGQTEAALTAMPGYEDYRARARAILDDKQQIALPENVQGDMVTNLWRDAKNPRGLWRVSPLAAYRAGKPQWRTLIDVDALGKQEGKSWVWHGANCLAPDYKTCLVSLSPGGTDADVVRTQTLKRADTLIAAGNCVDAETLVREKTPDDLAAVASRCAAPRK
jgi:prolyl oligopeptidase